MRPEKRTLGMIDDPMNTAFRVTTPVLSRREPAKVQSGAQYEHSQHDSASWFQVDATSNRIKTWDIRKL